VQIPVNILIDGSNVLFWQGGQAVVDVPELVVRALRARRFVPVIYFDNTISRHLGKGQLEALEILGDVVIAPAGTAADTLLLDACGKGKLQIVSNDHYRDWRQQYPELQSKWLVTGSVGKGRRVCFSKKLRPAPL